MAIGKRKQVQLVKITPARSGEGNWNAEAETTYDTWAEISNPSSFRDYAAGQTKIGETKRFRVRFNFSLHPGVDWKVRYDNKDWVVSSILKDDEKRFYWNITATS